MKEILVGALLASSFGAVAFADQAQPPAAERKAAPPPAASGSAAGYAAPAVVAPQPKTPPPMPEMKPAPEIAAAAKLMAGSYKCKGVDMNPDGSSRPSISTLKISTDLDGYYLLVDLAEEKTKDNATPFKAHMYRTFDGKKWTNTLIASAPGGPMTMTSTDAMGTGAVTWVGSGSMAGQAFTEKSHEEPDAKTKSVHIWGEFSMDGGKTFMKDYDITCKK